MAEAGVVDVALAKYLGFELGCIDFAEWFACQTLRERTDAIEIVWLSAQNPQPADACNRTINKPKQDINDEERPYHRRPVNRLFLFLRLSRHVASMRPRESIPQVRRN